MTQDDSSPHADIVLDSLPYIDPVHEDYESYALALIEEEMKSITAPALKPLPNSFTKRSQLLQTEIKAIQENGGRPIAVDFVSKIDPPKSVDEGEWREAVQKARAEYQAELARSHVLEAQKSNNAATSQWQQWNSFLDGMVQDSTNQLDQQRSVVDELNKKRQEQQHSVGNELRILETKYHERIHTMHQLSMATTALEQEVDRLKQKMEKNK